MKEKKEKKKKKRVMISKIAISEMEKMAKLSRRVLDAGGKKRRYIQKT